MTETLTHPDLDGGAVVHGFFTREDGVSKGIYEGLNCGPGSDDDPAFVAENRRLVAAHLSGRRDTPVMSCYQEHGNNTVTVTGPWRDSERPKADAMVTNRPGIILGILTADCAPVLFADAEAGVIGAAHAGWKGAVGGILESTLLAMEALGARRSGIRAVVGPCIARPSYEVGTDFFGAVTAADACASEFLTAGKDSDHFRFDLEGYVLDRLARIGALAPAGLATDTYADENRFFSYRRTTHRGEPDYGRQISAIMLRE